MPPSSLQRRIHVVPRPTPPNPGYRIPLCVGYKLRPARLETLGWTRAAISALVTALGAHLAGPEGPLVRVPGRPSTGQADVQPLAAHKDTTQMLEDLPRHALGQIDQAMVILDGDAADETTLQARLVGDGADDFARGHPIAMTYLDAVTHQASVVALAPTCSPLLAGSKFPPRLRPVTEARRRSLWVRFGARGTLGTVRSRRPLALLQAFGPLRPRGALRPIQRPRVLAGIPRRGLAVGAI